MNIDKKAYLEIDKYEHERFFHGIIRERDFYTTVYPCEISNGSYVASKIISDQFFDRTCSHNFINRANGTLNGGTEQ